MSGRTFKTYVDIFDINEHTSQAAENNQLQFESNSFEYISKGDIIRGDSNNDVASNIVQRKGGSEICPTAYDLVPIENSLNSSQTSSEATGGKQEKLCGFLRVHKSTDRNKNRRRWFVFSEENCRLLYFKTPHDMIPRCDIDIANSSFYIHVNESGCSAQFEIRIRDDVYILEASDQKTMFYWLQELQKYRRCFSARKAKSLPLKLSVPGHMDETKNCEEFCPTPVLESVTLPRETVGDHTRHQTVASTQSFVNLRDEMRKVMTTILNKRESSSGIFQNIRTKVTDKTKNLRQKRSQESLPTFDDSETEGASKRCSCHQDQVAAYRDEITQVEEELHATREITRILQKQLDELHSQIQLRSKLEEVVDQEPVVTTLLQGQNKKIVDLEYLLTATQEEKEILKANYKTLQAEVGSLKEQVVAFKASLVAKDTVVMALASELNEKEARVTNQTPTTNHTSNTSASLLQTRSTQEKMDRLQDMVEGYKLQNQFLNQELLELNKLRQDSGAMVQQLIQTCVKLETLYYDVHRKYAACLKELGKVQAEEEGATSVELLQRLLQDAMLSSAQFMPRDSHVPTANLLQLDDASSLIQYDSLGFPVSPIYPPSSFDDTCDTIEKQSDAQYIKAKSIEHNLSVSMAWERFLANSDLAKVDKSTELKELIRAGVPSVHRAKLWKRCVEVLVGRTRAGFGENYYNDLIEHLKLSDNLLSTAAKQIELDLLRTLPGNKHYENILSGNVPKLRRVLLAYSNHDPITGYCQNPSQKPKSEEAKRYFNSGLNRLAAIALLMLEEEDAFWCLIAVVNFLLPHNYFCAGMQGAHMDQRVLVDLVQEKLPALYNHFKAHNVDLTLFTFNWFLTVYIDNIPTQTYLRIWDSFLYEGSKVLFRYALAFLRYKEQEIMTITDSGDLYMYMRKLGESMVDVNHVSQIAFKELNPFPMKYIHTRRQHHLVLVKAELAKMDQMRYSCRVARPGSVDE